MSVFKSSQTAAPNKRRLWAGVAAVALLAGLVGFAVHGWWRLTREPLPSRATGFTFVVHAGESLDHLARRLAKAGVLDHWWDLVVLARVRDEGTHVQAGEYRIPHGITVSGLLGLMVQGRILLHRFTIVPGSTYRQVFTALESNSFVRHRLRGLSGMEVMRRLGHPNERPEGRFFPNTYFFARGTPDIQILARAYSAMRNYLVDQWQKRALDLPLRTSYQALTIASIVEKETAVPAERSRIAGVFIRRLERRMRLDADPTVIYGLGSDYHQQLTRADLERNTPYNTYLHYGLPPTPICMPGAAAIVAAMHPQQGKALYFVAKGNGTHVFSDTLAEQRRMIEKYELKGGHEKSGNGGSGQVHHP